MFEHVVEQEDAKRRLTAAVAEGPAHAYLFHGPRGVGKRTTALAFAGALLGDPERVERRAHPDLFVLEPLGDQIRIDAVRELHHDLHMRPFEAARRVYLVLGADALNEDAADALLKDLEEPPPYAVIVLVAEQVSRLPDTIRSRCQHIAFKRLSRQAIEERLMASRPDLDPAVAAAVSRIAGGRLDRAERLLDPDVASRRAQLVELARAVYLDEDLDTGEAAAAIVDAAREAGAEAARADAEDAEGTAREREQRARRIARGVEREEILGALDLLAGWYRDLLAASLGATGIAFNADRVDELASDGERVTPVAAERALEAVLETTQAFELNVSPPLALEALFVRLRRAFGAPGGARQAVS